MKLISETVDDILVAAQSPDAASHIYHIVSEAISERTQAMHERAQAAEGRAAKAERTADRIARRVGRIPFEPLDNEIP